MLKLFEKTFWKLLDIFFPLPKVKDELITNREASKEFNKFESKLPDDDPKILAEEIRQTIIKLNRLVNKLDPLSSFLEATFSYPSLQNERNITRLPETNKIGKISRGC